jgi:hypothetical protein
VKTEIEMRFFRCTKAEKKKTTDKSLLIGNVDRGNPSERTKMPPGRN